MYQFIVENSILPMYLNILLLFGSTFFYLAREEKGIIQKDDKEPEWKNEIKSIVKKYACIAKKSPNEIQINSSCSVPTNIYMMIKTIHDKFPKIELSCLIAIHEGVKNDASYAKKFAEMLGKEGFELN